MASKEIIKLTEEEQKTIFEKLPELCYSVLVTANKIIVLKRGETGYFPLNWSPAKTLKEADDWCNLLNDRLDITKAQRKAMEMGSLCGWETNIIDPDYYDLDK